MGERMGELINLTITMVIKVDIGLTHKENFMDYVVMMPKFLLVKIQVLVMNTLEIRFREIVRSII
jgi:hypothetical protein